MVDRAVVGHLLLCNQVEQGYLGKVLLVELLLMLAEGQVQALVAGQGLLVITVQWLIQRQLGVLG
jgi:hypothetical protein